MATPATRPPSDGIAELVIQIEELRRCVQSLETRLEIVQAPGPVVIPAVAVTPASSFATLDISTGIVPVWAVWWLR